MSWGTLSDKDVGVLKAMRALELNGSLGTTPSGLVETKQAGEMLR